MVAKVSIKVGTRESHNQRSLWMLLSVVPNRGGALGCVHRNQDTGLPANVLIIEVVHDLDLMAEVAQMTRPAKRSHAVPGARVGRSWAK